MNALGPTLIALSLLIALEMRARPDSYRTGEITGVAWLLTCSVSYSLNPQPVFLVIAALSAGLWLTGLTRRLGRRE